MLACLGHVDQNVVRAVNDVVETRIREDAGGRTPEAGAEIEGPRLSRRALAASQGEEVPEVMGVMHKVSEAKAARGAAKWADKQAGKHNQRWHCFHNCLAIVGIQSVRIRGVLW
jgi:hypothetical protein